MRQIPLQPAITSLPARGRWIAVPTVCVAALLSACGGGGEPSDRQAQGGAPLAMAATILQLDPGTLSPQDAQQVAQPSFHMAPVLLDAPADAVAFAESAAVHRQAIPAEFHGLASRRLTVQAMQSRHAEAARGLASDAPDASDAPAVPDASAAPQASGGTVATYTPAQIRAAYGLPALPVVGAALSASQAAQLGAGQTIYIVDAQHDPNVAAELAAFNQKFSLPACTVKTIAGKATLPAPGGSCELSVVYSTATGAMTSAPPAYDAGWATEIALDVQWAHATAPLARIVLIETASASYDNLLGGVRLANALGPGIVSMSFGGAESSTTNAADSVFSVADMSYLAATGDSGAGVSWPAVSAHVLAVGGTTLSYSGAGQRAEVAWSGTGGGVSKYVPTPAYQSVAVPGMGTASHRTVADVAFNADPSSGQYVAVIASGGGAVRWASVGGTSLATPQWAGLVAVANAMRAVNGKAALGAPHAALYGQIATVPGTYAGAFADVLKGSDGGCAACSAKSGYDQLTGLGTPNAAALLGTLSGLTVATTPVVAPPLVVPPVSSKAGGLVITAPAMVGLTGRLLTGSIDIADAGARSVSVTIAGAPVGMMFLANGMHIEPYWLAAQAGSYQLKIVATDSAGASAQATVAVTVTQR